MELAASELIGTSDVIVGLMRKVPIVAKARRTTMISGPTGAGKEVLASLLHRQGSTPKAPYVPVHCAALPEPLAESELFGHTKGAFTGAATARPGLIRTACGGTLFLDEIDSLSLSVQAKLLRFLETGEYRPVGSDRIERARVWVLAATNCDLRERISDGRFRADLFYRLEVMHLRLPALKLRKGDVELLARHFLARVAPAARFSARSVSALYEYDWPGNVRELKHRVERAAVLAEGGIIEPRDLEFEGRLFTPPAVRSVGPEETLWRMIEEDGLSLTEALARCEQTIIRAALDAEENNRTRAAARLGIHVRTIFKKLAR